ncbi:2OG-Fe(II) oxygenase [Pseudooceanicola sp. C21-150M6]|uniref:2OG-Fe(II) oxygenase n=1 Tax=Pseudooceanicola sp. C21-150M6 TaxID=3434355 RepID=UPI003D7FA5FA
MLQNSPGLFLPGTHVPTFTQTGPNAQPVEFDGSSGRFTVLCFLGSLGNRQSTAAAQAMKARPDLFDGQLADCILISTNPGDASADQIYGAPGSYQLVLDLDGKVSDLFGSTRPDAIAADGRKRLTRFWLIVDPEMKTVARISFRDDMSDISDVIQLLERQPRPGAPAGPEIMAPILFLPNVFEADLCTRLVALHQTQGSAESGVMRNVAGRTVEVADHTYKSRRDHEIADKALISTLQQRFRDRVMPHIAKAYQFQVTRMERYIVSCYAAEEGGHFAPHRDDTTYATAHRRFAVSINLNDDFDGGEVSFPEFGSRSFRAPPGGAVVFSCSLLHAVSQVSRGRRYAFLPFLFDEAAARIREKHKASSKGARPGATPAEPAV